VTDIPEVNHIWFSLIRDLFIAGIIFCFIELLCRSIDKKKNISQKYDVARYTEKALYILRYVFVLSIILFYVYVFTGLIR